MNKKIILDSNKNNKVKPVPFYLPAIAIFSLLLLVIYFVYNVGWFGLIFKSNNTSDSTYDISKQNTKDLTLNWKVYKGGDYEFSYPENIGVCTTSISSGVLDLEGRDVRLTQVVCNKDNSVYMQMVRESTNQDLIEWWYSLYSDHKNNLENNGNHENITFAGKDAIKLTFQKRQNEDYNRIEILLHHKDKNYVVLFPHLNCADKVCPEKPLEIQMQTSFKLLDENIIPWDEAIKKIQNCEITKTEQRHDLSVELLAKNGVKYKTTEPVIDEVIKVEQRVRDKCLIQSVSE